MGGFRLWGTRPGGRVPTAALTASGWVVGLVVTALILGTPYLVFGYHSPSLHLVLGTIDACVALLVAYLLYGRFSRSHRLQDLLLAQGLLLLAIAGLGLVLFLHLFDEARPGTLDVWLPMALRTVGALLIVTASLAGHDRVVRPGFRWRTVLPWAALGVGLFGLWLLRDLLPVAVGGRAPASAQRPVITGHPVLLSLQGFTAVCFMVASLAFTREAARRHDALVRWLGPACALGAFARVNYVLFPSLYSDWLYTGDMLRTGCYLLLLVGAAREIGEYWSAHARAAVLDDRRRLAREIHDGLVQEIAYIRAETQLAGVGGSTGEIVAACDRALDEARAAVDALGRSGDEPLGLVLHRGAQQVAERYGARLEVDLDDSVTADVDQRHALVRIAREAVSNAVRHGNAQRVLLRLTRDEAGCRLVVEDDGRGFDPAALAQSSSGFGLTSMRERACALPGSFELDSEPGRGTTVGVTW